MPEPRYPARLAVCLIHVCPDDGAVTDVGIVAAAIGGDQRRMPGSRGNQRGDQDDGDEQRSAHVGPPARRVNGIRWRAIYREPVAR